VRELVWEEHTFADVEGHQVLSHQAAHAWVQAAKEMDRSHKDVRDSLRAKRRQTQLLLKEMNRPHKDRSHKDAASKTTAKGGVSAKTSPECYHITQLLLEGTQYNT